jgi:hypothetical protein
MCPDHAFLVTPYIVDSGVETMNPLFQGDPEAWSKALEQWEKDGSGLLGNK